MSVLKIIPFVIAFLLSAVAPSDACWFFYHESKLEGTLLDSDTKRPIEGAVVVAEYENSSWFLSPDSGSSVFNVRETVTDKDGHFRIPSYMTLLCPNSWKIPGELIIYKSGYISVELKTPHFAGEELKVEKEYSWVGGKALKYKLRGRGVVELPKVRSTEERINATRTTISGYHATDLPLLYKALNEECSKLNLPEYR